MQQMRRRGPPPRAKSTAGRASRSMRAPAFVSVSASALEQAAHLPVDRAGRLVEPGGDAEVGELRRRGGRQRATSAHARAPAAHPPPRRARARGRPRVRASGPITLRSRSLSVPGSPGMCPRCGTSPWLGLWPNTPQQWDGTRIEPPMSLPSSREVKPGGDGRRRAAGGSAGRARAVPGVVRGAEDRVRGLPVSRPGRRVGLAEDHGAGGARGAPPRRRRRRARAATARARRRWCEARPSRRCPSRSWAGRTARPSPRRPRGRGPRHRRRRARALRRRA